MAPRSPARPHTNGSAGKRLSVILENGDNTSPPAPPPRVFSRPFSRRLYRLGDPLHHGGVERPPPPYSPGAAAVGDRASENEKSHNNNVRNRSVIARRGGWKRLLLVALVALVVIVALVVGLVVGLRKRHKSQTSPSGPAPPSPSSTAEPGSRFSGPFPAGSYTFNTFLDLVDTSCVANPDTFRCYPYQTYNDSAPLSASNFNWIISSSDSSNRDLTISSTDNPFSLNFESLPLRVLDAGTSEERLEYQVSMDKVVVPSSPITKDNSIASCFFNGTIFHAELYTKKLKTYPPGASSTDLPNKEQANVDDFHPWPYAVRIEQSIHSGDNIPTCYKTRDGRLGERLPDGDQPVHGKGTCRCLYLNRVEDR